MSPDFILYILIGAATVSTLASQKLTTTITGPVGVKAAVNLLRLVVIGLWIWFGFATGYWQIAVVVGVSAVIALAGILAKGKA